MANANAILAATFAQMSDLMQILGHDPFRVNAFARAARTIEDLAIELSTIGPDVKKLASVEGIGKGTAERIAEFLTTGGVKEHQELLAQVPPGVLAMIALPGVGPKTAAMLWKDAGIDTLELLRAKAQTDELTTLKGFGAKKLENLRKSLTIVEQASQRHLIGYVRPTAQWFVQQLEQLTGVSRAAYAGSLRRGRETVGDLDLLVACEPAHAIAVGQAFVKLEPVADVLAQGPTKSSVRTREGLQVDLRVVEPAQFGAALMYFTGSKEHNVQLRQRAIDQGLRLNEYGLTRDSTLVASATEEEIYAALDLAWVPPELREGRGELALAQARTLPSLLSTTDIHAELHCHTTASDGRFSIRELTQIAIELGYHTLAITDHSQSQTVAHGLKPARLEQHIQDIRAAAREFHKQINLLAGSEVDILPDGKLDYPDSLLRELDLVVASPHAALSQEPTKATARLLKAMENRYVTIMGHPTGRLVNRREGMSPDMTQIVSAAKQRGIALEINANTHRLDLRDSHARLAIESGVKLAINTDAHSLPDLDQLIYGVLTARRAGATANDVINCMSREALATWIKSTKR
jgi:DNA polymerase (family X)